MRKTLLLACLVGGWLVTIAVLVGFSLITSANPSTIAALVALGATPPVVIVLLGHNSLSRTVAEILHAVETKDGRG